LAISTYEKKKIFLYYFVYLPTRTICGIVIYSFQNLMTKKPPKAFGGGGGGGERGIFAFFLCFIYVATFVGGTSYKLMLIIFLLNN
jgi:hypothetical protein